VKIGDKSEGATLRQASLTSFGTLQCVLLEVRPGTPRTVPNDPKNRYNWVSIHILYETEKAILINNGLKTWVPKSCIHGIRLKGNVFEIYVERGMVG